MRLFFRRLASQAVDADQHFLVRRRGLLLFAGGFFFGGGGLSGAAVLRWNQDAARPPEEESKAERKRRKLEAKLAAKDDDGTGLCCGLLKRWMPFGWSWLPHWMLVEAEVRQGLLLLRRAADHHTSSINFAEGARCVAVPLSGAKIEVGTPRSSTSTAAVTAASTSATHDIHITTSAGEHEVLRVSSTELQDKWARALKGVRTAHRRVVEVAFPSTWEQPLEAPRLVPLSADTAEYKHVERLALSQQLKTRQGQAYVKGVIEVTGVSRVQAPHVWEQVPHRRACVCACMRFVRACVRACVRARHRDGTSSVTCSRAELIAPQRPL